MKTKGSPKKNFSFEADRFERKGAKVKPVQHAKSEKRRLSIYDDFNEEDDLNQYADDIDE
jgi:hypothetical protein